MRTKGHVNAVLLLVACAAGGCSKPFEDTKAQPVSAQAKPIAAPAAFDPKDEEGSGANATAKISGPVSFADADAAFQAKRYSEATALFERYTEQRPKNAWGHFMLGLSASKSGDLAKAETAFDTALSIDPNHVKSLVNLSRVLIDQHRYDEALVKLSSAGDLDPTSADVPRLQGRAYMAQGKKSDAADAYRRAIALDPKDAWSMNNLGLLFLEQKSADDALPLFARAVELRTDVAAFHNNLGMALEHTGRFAAAAAEYRGAVTADAGYTKAQQNLARVEAVKTGHEEPFDLAAAAKGSVEAPKVAGDASIAAR